MTANIIAAEIKKHQDIKNNITDDIVKEFFNPNRTLDIGGCYMRSEEIDKSLTDYTNYGINFDRTFGFKPKGSLF